MIVSALWALALAEGGQLPYPVGNGGLLSAWSLPWLANSPLAPYLGLACTAVVATLLITVNSTFNLLRNITRLQATAFIIMQMAAPAVVVHLCAPMASAAVVLCCMYLLFSIYGDRDATSTVFLIFFILSLCASWDVLFVALMPVFMLGCAQMRILSLRSISAMLIGTVTPWIILTGFGIVDISSIKWPQLQETTQSEKFNLPLVAAVSLSAFVTVAAWLQNLMKYLTYNAHSRAMLSMVTVLSLTVIILGLCNLSNLYASLPLLNVCAALQLGHLFGVVHTRPKSYIAILCVFLPFILLTIWVTILCI